MTSEVIASTFFMLQKSALSPLQLAMARLRGRVLARFIKTG